MKRQIFILVIMIISFTGIGQDSISTILYFSTDEFELTKENKAVMAKFVARWKEIEIEKIQIIGHTDSIGGHKYNFELSIKRAKSVSQELQNYGFDFEKIILNPMGETEPIKSNKTEATRKENRRVEIIAFFTSKHSELNINSEENLTNIDNLFESLATPFQTFFIFPERDTILLCKNGTILYFRKKSFKFIDDEPCHQVEIHVKEIDKKSDAIRENLTTITTDNKLLVSQSMLYIDAKCGDNTLEMVKNITVLSPANIILPNMRLFDGVKNSEGHIEWENPGSEVSSFSDRFGNSFISYQKVTCKFFFCRIAVWLGLREKPAVNYQLTNNNLNDYTLNNEMDVKFAEIDGKMISDFTKEDLEYYIYDRKLGWSNLDWLSKIENSIDFKISIVPDKNTEIRIVFKNQKSIVPLKKSVSNYFYNGLPIGEKAWVVGLKYIDGIPYLAMKEIVISNNDLNGLDFEKLSLQELVERLKVLD